MSKLVNNENKKMIVEFSHPGKEYIPYKRKDDPNVVFDNKSRDIGKRKWNNLNNHKESLLNHMGIIFPKINSFKTEPLTFWGEWEAESYFERINFKDHLNLCILQFWTWVIMVLQNTIQILLFLVTDFGIRTANKVKRIENLF